MAQSVLELTLLYGHPLYMDTPFLLTVCFVPGTFSLNLTRLIRTSPLIRAPSVSVTVLTGFDCLDFQDHFGGGRGGGGGGVKRYQSTTVVPSHFQIRSYGPVSITFLVSQTKTPIAKSLPKTLDLKSTIFVHRIGLLRQNHLH